MTQLESPKRSEHAQLEADLSTERAFRELLELRLASLMKLVGAPGTCRGCGALILWVKHRNGVNAPYNPDGINHFATCPKAKAFKK